MFVFVILHYLSENMTRECIKYIIERFSMENYHIVIVDNASADGSGERLKTFYHNTVYCSVILNEENLGFARGNNVGYEYAKRELGPNYIIIMNNDVLIKDTNFLDGIDQIYQGTKFHVLGPDILSCKTKLHQNPIMSKGFSKREVNGIINTNQIRLAIYPLYYFYRWLYNLAAKRLARFWKPERHMPENINPLAKKPRVNNPVLHGACLVFSKRFIEREEIAFDPDTFLYFEEDILHYNCMKKGYIMLYDSSIKVMHMEDVSTDIAYKTHYEVERNKLINSIQSGKVLLDLMEGKGHENQ